MSKCTVCMLLTITTTHKPATDLGFLLHKNPTRVHTVDLGFGGATVFYPTANEDICTVAMYVEIDAIGLVRGRGSTLAQYVNDRPYVCSSFTSVALGRVFGTAMGGRSKERSELASTAIPLEATLSIVACKGGEDFIRRMFEPLGYAVSVRSHVLDERFSEWGDSHYFTVIIFGDKTVRDLLTHLYVLIPVLDSAKHYFIGSDEVDKLLLKGKDWLPSHPEKSLIVNRYLRYRIALTRDALRGSSRTKASTRMTMRRFTHRKKKLSKKR